MITNKRILYVIAAVAWMGLIFYLSSIPDLKSSLPTAWDTIFRKIAHMLEFGILYALLKKSFQGYWDGGLEAASLALAYAIFDEVHQNFVEGRIGTPADVLIDSMGIFIAWLSFIFVGKIRMKRKKFT